MALEKSKYFPKCAFTFSFENILLHYKYGYAQRGFYNSRLCSNTFIQINSSNTRFFLNSLLRTLLTLLNLTTQSSHSSEVKTLSVTVQL